MELGALRRCGERRRDRPVAEATGVAGETEIGPLFETREGQLFGRLASAKVAGSERALNGRSSARSRIRTAFVGISITRSFHAQRITGWRSLPKARHGQSGLTRRFESDMRARLAPTRGASRMS